MKINILDRMVMALVIGALSLAGVSIAADGQQEQHEEQHRVQQQQQQDQRQQQKQQQRLSQQQLRLRNERFDYDRDPYFYTAPIYRYNRAGRYYETNEYGAKILGQAVNHGYEEASAPERQTGTTIGVPTTRMLTSIGTQTTATVAITSSGATTTTTFVRVSGAVMKMVTIADLNMVASLKETPPSWRLF